SLALVFRKRSYRVVVETPSPTIFIVDRNPEMAMDGGISPWRNHREARHHPGGDPSIVIASFRVAPRTNEKTARLFDYFEDRSHVVEIVLVAFRPFKQRIRVQVAAVQKGDMTRIAPAL